MRSRSAALTIVLLVALSPAARAGDFLSGHPRVADAIKLLETWIEEQRIYSQLPGLSIGIVYQQELIWARGFGLGDLETRRPLTPATLFRIGSVTKLFTATAIMQLRDQGKLRLDDPVARYLPGFELHNPFPGAPTITIRHLLTHTGGLPREAAFPYWTDHEFPTRDEILASLPSQSAVFPPAETYKYSNLGMALLGQIVATVSGEEYSEYIQGHLFEPLGMTSSAVVPTSEHRRRMATAYMRKMADGSRPLFEYYETRGMAPAANIVSSIEDLARFAALHLRQDPVNGVDEVLRTSTLREMQRPHWVHPSWEGGRGLGFGISRRDGETIVFHGGWIGGHRSHFMLVPSQQVAIIVLVNADDGVPSTFSLEALDLVGPALVESTAPAPVEKQVDPAWQRYLGVYADPWGWEYEVMILDRELVLYSYNYPPEEDASAGITRLEPLGGDSFKMPDGELVVFEQGEDGTVARIKRRSDYLYPSHQ